MGVYIRSMQMPHDCDECILCAFIPVGDYWIHRKCLPLNANAEITIRRTDCPLAPVPEHGDLIDRDALIKDGWLNLHKEVIRMGGYAIHELPLKNSSIPVIIPAEPPKEVE